MPLKPLASLKNIAGQRVLVRCDFDIPLARRGQTQTGTQTGTRTNAEFKIADDSRLQACLPTIKYLLKKKAKIILIGHLGRPGGRIVPELSLVPIKDRLEQLLRIIPLRGIPHHQTGKMVAENWGTDYGLSPYEGSPLSEQKKWSRKIGGRITFIDKIDRYLGPAVSRVVGQMASGEIIMLENLRFSDREEKNCRRFAKKLSLLADYYINEAFAVSHRNEASVSAIREYLPSYAGLHLTEEIKQLSSAVSHPLKPLVLIIGGAKIETKLPVIKQFIGKADYILVGGAVANNFLKAEGVEVGKSLVDNEYLGEAQKILALKIKNYNLFKNYKIKNSKIILPLDWQVQDDKILDIGPATIKFYQDIIRQAKMIIWNGPMGKFEDQRFKIGTEKIAQAIIKSPARVIIGGGETSEILKRKKIPTNVFVSVGGGAMLEFLGGKKLPGL